MNPTEEDQQQQQQQYGNSPLRTTSSSTTTTLTNNNSSIIIPSHEQTPKINNSQSSRRLQVSLITGSTTTIDVMNDVVGSNTNDNDVSTMVTNDNGGVVFPMPTVPSLDHHHHHHHTTTTSSTTAVSTTTASSTVDDDVTNNVSSSSKNNSSNIHEDVLLGQLPITTTNNNTTTNVVEQEEDDEEGDNEEEEETSPPQTTTTSSSFFSWFTTTPPPPAVVAATTVAADGEADPSNSVDVVVVDASSSSEAVPATRDVSIALENVLQDENNTINVNTIDGDDTDVVEVTTKDREEAEVAATAAAEAEQQQVVALQKAEQVRISTENAIVFETTPTSTTPIANTMTTTSSTSDVTVAGVVATTSSTTTTTTTSTYDLEGIQWMIDASATRTGVPQANITLQLLCKFVKNTRSYIVREYGGTIPKSMWSYLFSSTKNTNNTKTHEYVIYHPYHVLVQILLDDIEQQQQQQQQQSDSYNPPPLENGSSSTIGDDSTSSTTILPTITGDSNNNNNDDDPTIQEKAQAALVTFIDLFSVWGHASSFWFASDSKSGSTNSNKNTPKQQQTYIALQVSIINTACQLITYGCLDDVYVTMISNNQNVVIPSSINNNNNGDDDMGPSSVIPSSNSNSSSMMAAQVLASSVFNSDLSNVKVELVAMKFLLCTGCSTNQNTSGNTITSSASSIPTTRNNNISLLRGSYLLQSIRTLYHIYLTTESSTNKVTARAALQQLVTSVFIKVVVQQQLSQVMDQSEGKSIPGAPPSSPSITTSGHDNTAVAGFPSENHRDAFLVLRSICKLSMRSLPDEVISSTALSTTIGGSSSSSSGNIMLQQHSHIGIQSSASNDTWDGDNRMISNINGMSNDSQNSVSSQSKQHQNQPSRASLIYTGAIHPALESKILALELLLYILQQVDFTQNDFIHHCGAQFHMAIRNYLCVSLLKNCTCNNTHIVNLSLRIFVPVVHNFRTVLKNEIEAFVTNVFFVILQSKNSPTDHKRIVVNTFNEICSDPSTLAEIFLNYDCDLSAVDLFYRIVNTLSRLSREGLQEANSGTGSMGIGVGGGASSVTSFLLGGGPSETQLEKQRNESRNLRLDAMRALRQILASLHASIVEPLNQNKSLDNGPDSSTHDPSTMMINDNMSVDTEQSNGSSTQQQTLVDIYGSKKKRRAEEQEAILRFNQKPSAGIAYAAKCHHIDAEDPIDVARYLLKNKDVFDKSMIGEYLGREKEYQNGFSLRVLHEYVRLLDFTDLVFDDAIRYFLSGFRLPGEAQKIDRIMEKFAERFTEQNPKVFPTADAAFILSFSIIMLNTDLHNPAIKEERRMTKEGFIRNNQGICDGKDLPDAMLISIFDRIKQNPISLKEDDEARERAGDSKKKSIGGLQAALNPASFFSSHYGDADRARESNFQKERDHIVRTTESLLKRRKHGSEQKSQARFRTAKSHRNVSRFVLSGDSGLRDEYVSPMFEVTWGPALAAFSTAMESANGTAGTLISIASDDELERAAENAAETIEVCLTGFRFAIGTAALCGNYIARDAYMLALSRFTQLGTGILLEPRHIRCIQTMFSLAKEDGELLGTTWEHVFRALSEVNRFHQVFQLMARNDRAAAQAAERRQRKLEAMEQKRVARSQRKAAAEDGESIDESDESDDTDSENDSLAESGIFSDEYEFDLEENMDAKSKDEANAREVYDAVSEATIEAIYERSSSLSPTAVMEFIFQLCQVSSAEISVGTNSRPGDINQVTYRQKHARLSGDQFHHTQPNIYNLQKLVEVTHYNMESRPRLLFADIWVAVADHLTNTALHSNPAVAMFAVDSFRQLSIQYLKRDELEVFEFQKRFLKPLETVMSLSKQSSTKELLLNCVGRLMHVFGTSSGSKDPTSSSKGGLRSGWVPILTILGIGGCDYDAGIAQTSFKSLSDEIKRCLNNNTHAEVLLTEYFVETVNALLTMNGSPHTEISILAVDYLVVLSEALADGTISPVQTKRKPQTSSTNISFDSSKDDESAQPLELWWPILLGLSKSIGDSRLEVRSKSVEVLFELINKYFFPVDPSSKTLSTWETVQLIFRGVLNSVLEFGETTSHNETSPSLPVDFEFLISESTDVKRPTDSNDDGLDSTSWLDTTFDPFMDSCIALCLRSLTNSNDSVLIEEIFALLNSCLLSDSGSLVIRGIRRLEQFVTSDLSSSSLTDDVWATVSHMLQRCLTVRGLPKKQVPSDGASEDEIKELETEYNESVKEFIAEDSFLLHRRFIGSNVTMTIGSLLSSERFSIGLRWRLFLIKWLYRGIREWDAAAMILNPSSDARQKTHQSIPDYRETALYGRKWINRLTLQLVANADIVQVPAGTDPKTNRFAQGQKQILEMTEGLLASFVSAEDGALQYRHTEVDTIVYNRYLSLVEELLSGFGMMDDEYLQQMSWMSPVLLSSGIRSKNEKIRFMVQKLVARTSPAAASAAPTTSASPTVTTSKSMNKAEGDSIGVEDNGNNSNIPEENKNEV